MDRRNFLTIIITLCLLITCGSKEQSVQATTIDIPDGFIALKQDGWFTLYMKETEDHYVYWSVASSTSGGTSVYAINKCKQLTNDNN